MKFINEQSPRDPVHGGLLCHSTERRLVAEIEECGPDGSIAAVGCFRTEADAQAWLTTNARIQQSRARVFRVGWPEDLPKEGARTRLPPTKLLPTET